MDDELGEKVYLKGPWLGLENSLWDSLKFILWVGLVGFSASLWNSLRGSLRDSLNERNRRGG